MAYATENDLITRYPATASATSAQRALALADAEAMIDDVQFGDRAVRAHAALSAHYLIVGGFATGGEGGLVSSRAAGAISVSYAVPDLGGLDPLLASTAPGRHYLQIVATLCSHPEVG